MDPASRLTTALALFLDCRARGDDPRQLLDEYPDLVDLLEPMCAENGGDAAADATLLGDYRLLREVGRGGMGIVYEARQLTLDRRVALKILAPDVANNPTQIARFQREARTLARLDHPHVVRVLDVGECAGQHWLAMEFVDGESLDQHLQQLQASGGHAGNSRRHLVEVIADVGDALQHVHDAGLLHRDIKPSNIILDSKGRARLTDFGLARDAEAPAMTQVGVIAGTPHYMSPEHLSGGDALIAASDVFSLGATLYECVLLRRAFDGDTTHDVLREILDRDPVDPRRLDATVPRDLAAIILKALEKDPARRYATARAFTEDLRAFLDLRPVAARPPSRGRRLARWARREPLQAALAGVLVTAVAFGSALLLQLPAVRAAERQRNEQTYEDSIASGDMARQAGDKDAAMTAFARARALFPERHEAVVWQCLALASFDGPAQALVELEKACGGETQDDAVEGLRAYLLSSTGQSEEAAAVTRRLGAPTTPTGMLFAATTLLQRNHAGDLDRARQLMSLAVRMSKQPRLFLYSCWAGVAPPEQRQECADAILALWPDNPLALQQAALCLAPTDPARAVPLMRRAIEGGVQSKNPHQLLAAMAFRAGERDTAVAAARQALDEDHLDDDLRLRLIENLLRQVEPDAATEEITAWLAREPDNPTALRLRALELTTAGKLRDALGVIEHALLARPDDADLLLVRCDLLRRAQNTTEALALAERLVAAHPANMEAHAALALLCRDGGDTTRLNAELRRWAHSQPARPEAWTALAAELLQQADPQAVREALAAIATADYLTGGKDAKILHLRARVHDALGEAAAAALCRNRAEAAQQAK